MLKFKKCAQFCFKKSLATGASNSGVLVVSDTQSTASGEWASDVLKPILQWAVENHF